MTAVTKPVSRKPMFFRRGSMSISKKQLHIIKPKKKTSSLKNELVFYYL